MNLPLIRLAAVIFFVTVAPISAIAQGSFAVTDYRRCSDEKHKNPRLAIQYCDRALKKPDTLSLDELVNTLISRGRAHANIGDTKSALRDYTAAIKANRFDGAPFFERGLFYLNYLDDPERAITDLTESMRLRKGTNPSFRGKAYFNKGDFDLAIVDMVKSLPIDPRNVVATRMEIASVHRGKGDFPGAIADYTEVLRLATARSRKQSIRAERAFVYYDAGLLDKASAELTELLRQLPNYSGAAVFLDLIDRRAGRASRLKDIAHQLDMTLPFGSVVELFLDKATPADVIRAYKSPKSNDSQFRWHKRRRLCTAKMLIAHHASMQGSKLKARRFYRMVADARECPWFFGPARAHLVALDK